ncbi:MAG: hypothetical protein CMH58_04215 [Myxococcales bacterium]|jgi:membrane-bound lytic murein transglycosylase F|nr:hypothetical protein [Myxococcales bacterium]|tara:strand:+ start:823 stop:2181 length:1359 start_codon:yes stop_codon:yes gene_type:complete
MLVTSACTVPPSDKSPTKDFAPTTPTVSDTLEPPRLLKVALIASAPDYFVYRGRPRGFVFDLSKILARRWQRRLQVEVARDEQEALQWLKTGRVEIAAIGTPLTDEASDGLIAGPAMEHSDSVLVSRNGQSPITIAALEGSTAADDLVGRCVPPCQQQIVPRPKSTWGFLKAFQEGRLKSQGILIPRRYAEAFIKMHPQLQIREGWGTSRPVSWWLHPRDQDLLVDLASFLKDIQKQQLYPVLRYRYYSQPQWMILRSRPFVRTDLGGVMTPWDPILKAAGRLQGFDWHLLGAIILRESGHNRHAVSSAGARGPVQLMPGTAKELGVDDPSDPAQAIPAAARYLRRLINRYSSATSYSDQRLMALAAYNVGPGHVDDARILARQLQLDPNKWWEGVALALPLLNKSAYGLKARHGPCQGRTAVGYAEDVEMLYDQYQQVLPQVLLERDGGTP